MCIWVDLLFEAKLYQHEFFSWVLQFRLSLFATAMSVSFTLRCRKWLQTNQHHENAGVSGKKIMARLCEHHCVLAVNQDRMLFYMARRGLRPKICGHKSPNVKVTILLKIVGGTTSHIIPIIRTEP